MHCLLFLSFFLSVFLFFLFFSPSPLPPLFSPSPHLPLLPKPRHKRLSTIVDFTQHGKLAQGRAVCKLHRRGSNQLGFDRMPRYGLQIPSVRAVVAPTFNTIPELSGTYISSLEWQEIKANEHGPDLTSHIPLSFPTHAHGHLDLFRDSDRGEQRLARHRARDLVGPSTLVGEKTRPFRSWRGGSWYRGADSACCRSLAEVELAQREQMASVRDVLVFLHRGNERRLLRCRSTACQATECMVDASNRP